MEIDRHVEDRDADSVVKALVESEGDISYKKSGGKPLIQILRDGCWFIQKRPGGLRGLGEDKLKKLLDALKAKKK